MFKLLKPRHRSMLGLDISSNSIKGVELLCTGEKFQLLAYGSESLPKDAVDGHIIRDVDAVAQAIRQLILRANFKSERASVAIPDSAVISKIIQVNDGLNDADMEEFVIVEAEKFIPFPIQEINLDFQIIGPSIKNPIMVDVLVVATRSENVNSRAEAINKAGLKASIVDVESYAVERATRNLLSQDCVNHGQEKIIAIFDIGAKFSNLFILKNLKIIFTREEEFGGGHLEQELERVYGPASKEMYISQPETLPQDFAVNMLEPFLDTLALHVKRSLQFFFSTTSNTHVDNILMAGGIAKIPNIALLISQKTGVDTQIANPLSHLIINKNTMSLPQAEKDSPSLIVACGLALCKGNR